MAQNSNNNTIIPTLILLIRSDMLSPTKEKNINATKALVSLLITNQYDIKKELVSEFVNNKKIVHRIIKAATEDHVENPDLQIWPITAIQYISEIASSETKSLILTNITPHLSKLLDPTKALMTKRILHILSYSLRGTSESVIVIKDYSVLKVLWDLASKMVLPHYEFQLVNLLLLILCQKIIMYEITPKVSKRIINILKFLLRSNTETDTLLAAADTYLTGITQSEKSKMFGTFIDQEFISLLIGQMHLKSDSLTIVCAKIIFSFVLQSQKNVSTVLQNNDFLPLAFQILRLSNDEATSVILTILSQVVVADSKQIINNAEYLEQLQTLASPKSLKSFEIQKSTFCLFRNLAFFAEAEQVLSLYTKGNFECIINHLNSKNNTTVKAALEIVSLIIDRAGKAIVYTAFDNQPPSKINMLESIYQLKHFHQDLDIREAADTAYTFLLYQISLKLGLLGENT